MRLKILVLAPLLLLLCAACEPQPSIDNPIEWGPKVSYYNNQLRVSGNGRFYNDAASRAANLMSVADENNDGNTVYGVTDFYFWLYDSGCNCSQYKETGRQSTNEWENSTHSQTLKWNLDIASNSVRGASFVCAQMGWPVPNSCSSAALPTFSY